MDIKLERVEQSTLDNESSNILTDLERVEQSTLDNESSDILTDLERAKQFAFENGAAHIIRTLLRKNNCSVQDLAKVLRIKPQSLSTKLSRDRFTFHEVQKILYILNYRLAVHKKNDDDRVY